VFECTACMTSTLNALANCGPASLAMVLAYYGVDTSTWDLRVRAMKAQHSWVSDDGGYSDGYGVFVYNLATVAEGLGLRVDGLWAREGGRVDRLHQWQPLELRRAILAGQPIIVEVKYGALPLHSASTAVDDHYIVVHGTLDGDFVYSDPLGIGSGGPDLTISEPDLMVAMGQASTPRVGFALLKAKS
jgi:Peptidase_C39 like family